MNLQEINNTINELENGDTTFSNCEKLANLYIVREHIQMRDNDVVKEYTDILPMYSIYCDIKRKHHLNEVTEQAVANAMENVIREIKEFITTLYANVDTEEERQQVINFIQNLKALY